LEAAGAAINLPQSTLTADELAKTVTGVLASPARMKELAAKSALRARPNAAREIAQRILAIV
jgi:UDP-N-acetylglucosamine:LPS N-acetylglucosamine transferase